MFEIKRLADDKEILLESRRMNKLQMSKLYDEMSSFMTDERERLGREMTNRLISKLQAQQKEQGLFFINPLVPTRAKFTRFRSAQKMCTFVYR